MTRVGGLLLDCIIRQSYFDAILGIFTFTVTVHDNIAASLNQMELLDSLIESYKRCKSNLNGKDVK